MVARSSKRPPALAEILRYRNARVIRGFLRDYAVRPAEARLLFREMLKLLWLGRGPETAPRLQIFAQWKPLDDMWHAFILHTVDYEAFCQRYFGRMIHHNPETRPPRHVSDATYARRVNAAVDVVWDELGSQTADLWFRIFWERYTPEFLEKHLRRPMDATREARSKRRRRTLRRRLVG